MQSVHIVLLITGAVCKF